MAEPIPGNSAVQGSALARVAQLETDIARGGDETQQLRRLPDELRDQLIDAGLFRFTLPTELGGNK